MHGRTGFTTHTVTLPINNGPFEGAWLRVGTTPFRFDATPAGQTGGPGKVVIKGPATAGVCVPADAVRWTKIGPIAVFQDNDDPTGITLSTKLAGQTAAWESVADNFALRYATSYVNYRNMAFGLNAMRANNNNQRATYTPALPEQGLYDVYVWYPHSSNNAVTGQLTIHGTYDGAGTSVDVVRTLNQLYDAGAWTHAGRYILDANPPGGPAASWLTIEPNNNISGKTTKADGALFLRDGEETDTDGDGLPDWKEIVLHTNSSGLDLNNDGIADGWDTDGDGLSDGYEYSLGLNPLTPLQTTTDTSLVGFTVLTPLIAPAQ